ncbi:MAG: FAD-dependent oxidoreductase [Christensenellales bacterium]
MVFDMQTDVLVVGSGAAAFSAAITAKMQGADVIMLEKGPLVGGTTLRSGGGYWIPNNRFQREKGIADVKIDALRYMARYSYPHLYNPEDARLGLPENEFALMDTYCEKASQMVDFMEESKAVQSMQDINWTGKPQVDYMDHLPENKGVRGRVLFSKDREGKLGYGGELIRQMKSWASTHEIKILLNHQATQILQNTKKEVIGLEVRVNGEATQNFRALKAVIFGSGGYTHNPELLLHFQRGPVIGGCAAPTNTGDFIKMAGAIGAKLGNMAGAFRAEIILEQALSDPDGVHNVFYIPGDSVLEVNRYGRRIMDEKRNYHDRTMTHYVWDPQRAEWTNLLVLMIYDQRTATLWQGFPPYPVSGVEQSHIIAGNTFDELTDAISSRLQSLKGSTGGATLAPEFRENLKQTVNRFNGFARSGHDEEFNRGEFNYDREWTTFPPTVPGAQWPPSNSSNYTMHPLSDNGPYYAIILAPGTLDTNGGPVINPRSQVMDVNGNPIRGLFGAGNCIASPAANAYWGGGSTLGPAMTFGYIAGLNATAEPHKEI